MGRKTKTKNCTTSTETYQGIVVSHAYIARATTRYAQYISSSPKSTKRSRHTVSHALIAWVGFSTIPAHSWFPLDNTITHSRHHHSVMIHRHDFFVPPPLPIFRRYQISHLRVDMGMQWPRQWRNEHWVHLPSAPQERYPCDLTKGMGRGGAGGVSKLHVPSFIPFKQHVSELYTKLGGQEFCTCFLQFKVLLWRRRWSLCVQTSMLEIFNRCSSVGRPSRPPAGAATCFKGLNRMAWFTNMSLLPDTSVVVMTLLDLNSSPAIPETQ